MKTDTLILLAGVGGAAFLVYKLMSDRQRALAAGLATPPQATAPKASRAPAVSATAPAVQPAWYNSPVVGSVVTAGIEALGSIWSSSDEE